MMNKFVFAYYGEPHFTSEAEGKKYMTDWREWVKSLGTASVDRGVPTKAGKTVSSHGVKDADGKDRFTGYSIVQAASLDEAVFFKDTAPTEIYALSLHDALPISEIAETRVVGAMVGPRGLEPRTSP